MKSQIICSYLYYQKGQLVCVTATYNEADKTWSAYQYILPKGKAPQLESHAEHLTVINGDPLPENKAKRFFSNLATKPYAVKAVPRSLTRG